MELDGFMLSEISQTEKDKYCMLTVTYVLFSCSVVSNLCNPMNCGTVGLPVLHNLLEFAQTQSIASVVPSNHLILCHPLLLLPSISPTLGSFPVSQFFASSGQSIGISASASVLPMNIQD